jgi:polyol permease family
LTRSDPTRPIVNRRLGLFDKVGIYSPLAPGYVGLLLFMIGDGVESNYLAPFLVDRGLTPQSAAAVIAFYGITVSIGAWLSGSMSSILGPRRVMVVGAVLWVALEVAFLLVGVPSGRMLLILLTYGLRGIAFPLFAYSFLVWINRATPPMKRARSVGWFWFAFTAGLPTLGSLLASVAIPRVGQFGTFWIALSLVALGSAVGILGVREKVFAGPSLSRDSSRLREICRGINILWRQPKMAAGMVARIFSTVPGYGSFILLPIVFVRDFGFTLSEVLLLATFIGTLNIFTNVLAGFIGDRFGWRRTTMWVGCAGSAVSTLLLYVGPAETGPDMWVAAACCMLFGGTLAGYSPFTVLMPACARTPGDRDSALSIYTLGAGLSAFVGPALVALFITTIGFGGLTILFACLHVVNFFIVSQFRCDEDPHNIHARAG